MHPFSTNGRQPNNMLFSPRSITEMSRVVFSRGQDGQFNAPWAGFRFGRDGLFNAPWAGFRFGRDGLLPLASNYCNLIGTQGYNNESTILFCVAIEQEWG